MRQAVSRSLAVGLATIFTVFQVHAVTIPKPLKSRFILGDPVWRELPVREELQGTYDRLWQNVVNTILENSFDIATMDKDSGYVRTTWNEGILSLGGNWFYKVQVSVKLVSSQAEGQASPKGGTAKVRLQVTGELSQAGSAGLRQFHRGYDQVIMQNLIQDLQSKIGGI